MHILETDAVGDAMISLFEIVDDNAIEDEQTRQDKMAIDYSLGFYRVMRRFLACPSVTVPSSVESGILQFENTDEQFSDCKTSAVVFTSEEIADELRPKLFADLKFQTVQMSPPELLSRLGVRDPTASFDSIYLNGIITVPFPNESLTEAIQSFETTRLLEYTLGDVTGASAVSPDDALDALLKRTVYTIPSMAVAGNKGPCVIEADDGDTVVPLFLDKLAAATFVHRQASTFKYKILQNRGTRTRRDIDCASVAVVPIYMLGLRRCFGNRGKWTRSTCSRARGPRHVLAINVQPCARLCGFCSPVANTCVL